MRTLLLCICLLATASPAAAGGHHGLSVAVVACVRGEPAKCFAAATAMQHANIDREFEYSARDLRDRGLAIYDKKCTAGDAESCFGQGRELVRDPQGDVAHALGQIEKACSLGSGGACMFLADHHTIGDLLPEDAERALALYDRACAHGNGLACERLAQRIEESGKNGQQDRLMALHRKACEGDDRGGCRISGVAKLAAGDREGALADLSKACFLGDDPSCDTAGTLAHEPARAREKFLKACDADIASGCYHLADMFASGKGGKRDWGQAIALAERGCDIDKSVPCTHLDQLRKHEPDWHCANATECAKLCDEQIGHSCRRLAELRDGAADAYERACKAGDVVSCTVRGDQATTVGDGARWYELACKAGDHASCAFEKDPKLALRAWRDSCSRHNATACRLVARQLEADGDKDGDKFMQLACKMGDANACVSSRLAMQ